MSGAAAGARSQEGTKERKEEQREDGSRRRCSPLNSRRGSGDGETTRSRESDDDDGRLSDGKLEWTQRRIGSTSQNGSCAKAQSRRKSSLASHFLTTTSPHPSLPPVEAAGNSLSQLGCLDVCVKGRSEYYNTGQLCLPLTSILLTSLKVSLRRRLLRRGRAAKSPLEAPGTGKCQP